jgi:hypothetical protein
MTSARDNPPAGDTLIRATLARSLDSLAALLRSLKHDPALRALPVVMHGLTPPAAPSETELESSAAVVARTATCLRHLARRGHHED